MGALVLCCVFTAGYSWDMCVIPLILLTVSMACCLIQNKHNIVSAYVVFGLLALTAVSIFKTAGDVQTSLYESEKFLCFLLAFYIASTKDIKMPFIKTLSYITFVIAAIGILAYCGIINASEFVFFDLYTPRLQSVVKYANTTGVLLGTGYITCLEAYRGDCKKHYLYLSATVLCALFLTLSKALIPIFIFVGTLYIIKQKDVRSVFIYQNIVTAVFTIFIVYTSQKHMYFLCFLLCVALVVASGKCIFKNTIKLYRFWLIICLLGILAGIGIIIIKFESLTTLTGRLTYAADSLKLVSKYPIFGCGPGSWRYLEYGVQSLGYNVRYIHNSYLQFAVECGIPFLIAIVLIIVYSLKNTVNDKDYGYSAIILIIALHSMIDFDMSFGAILIILGIVCGSYFKNKTPSKIWAKIPVTILLITGIVTSVYSATEFIIRNSFEKNYINGNNTKAQSLNNMLIKLCPMDPQVYINDASIDYDNNGVTDKVRANLEKAVALSPNDYNVLKQYIKLLKTDENLKNLIKKYISLCPMQEDCYVYVKEQLKDALDKEIISEDKYDTLYQYTEEQRIKHKVKDRNQMLRDTVYN